MTSVYTGVETGQPFQREKAILMKKNNRIGTAFRFEEVFLEELRAASNATGMTITSIVEQCVERGLDQVVRQAGKDREAAQKRLLALRKR